MQLPHRLRIFYVVYQTDQNYLLIKNKVQLLFSYVCCCRFESCWICKYEMAVCLHKFLICIVQVFDLQEIDAQTHDNVHTRKGMYTFVHKPLWNGKCARIRACIGSCSPLFIMNKIHENKHGFLFVRVLCDYLIMNLLSTCL